MADKVVVLVQQALKPIKVVKWKVNEGNSISIGCVFLLYEVLDDERHMICKLKSSQAGTVHKILVQEGAVVRPGEGLLEIQACLHPTVMRDMCAECGADLRKEDVVTSAASVPMVHSVPELKVSVEQAQKIGKADVNRLLKDRKLVLLVDLDQTLIHTTNDNIPANIKDVYHFQLYGTHSPWYHTRLRPGTHRFLENMSPYFELHICTFGARNYAHMIAMFLDQDGKLFSQRILSRDECFNPTSKTANLKALFPCGDDLVCIIDDREDVWSHASNLIHVKPYHFFQHTGDINAPPGLDKHENDEKEGVDLTNLNYDSKKIKLNGKINYKSKETPTTHEGVRERENVIQEDDKEEYEDKSLVKNVKMDDKDVAQEAGKKEDVDLEKNVKRDDKEENKSTRNYDNPEENVKNNDNQNGKRDDANSEENVKKNEIEGGKKEDVNPEGNVENNDKEDIAQNEDKTEDVNSGENIKKNDKEEGKHDNVNLEVNLKKDDGFLEENVQKDDKEEDKKNDVALEENLQKDDKEEGKNDVNPEENLKKNKKDVVQEESVKEFKESGEELKYVVKELIIDKTKEGKTLQEKTIKEQMETSENGLNNGKEEKEEEMVEIDDPDDYLLYLEDILKEIHKTFYVNYDKMESGQVPDLKKVIPEVRKTILNDTKLVFSGLVPTHIKLEQSKAYQVARSLGAIVTQDLEMDTTHLVAVRPGTAKVNAGRRKKNLKIVTPDWLWACAERWTKVEEQLYNLNNKGSKNRHPPPHCSSPEHTVVFDEITTETPGRKRTASGRFMDTINPLMSFSSADIADMDREVEDIFNESESDGESSNKKPVPECDEVFLTEEVLDAVQNVNSKGSDESSSSSGESMTGEHPHGWKPHEIQSRKRSREDDADDESTADEFPSTKFRRGEELSSDLDIGQGSNSDGSVEPPDEIDDGDWNMMGAALEREFLSNN